MRGVVVHFRPLSALKGICLELKIKKDEKFSNGVSDDRVKNSSIHTMYKKNQVPGFF